MGGLEAPIRGWERKAECGSGLMIKSLRGRKKKKRTSLDLQTLVSAQ